MQTMGHVDVKTAMKYQHPELDIVRSALNDTQPGAPPVGAQSDAATAHFAAHPQNDNSVSD
jgi:hypothetical protein